MDVISANRRPLYGVEMLDPCDVDSAGSDGQVRSLPYLSPDTFASTYAARVHRFATMVMKNDQDSADLAQEALIKALRSLERFDPPRGSLDLWLWRIVVNTARDAGRASAPTGDSGGSFHCVSN